MTSFFKKQKDITSFPLIPSRNDQKPRETNRINRIGGRRWGEEGRGWIGDLKMLRDPSLFFLPGFFFLSDFFTSASTYSISSVAFSVVVLAGLADEAVEVSSSFWGAGMASRTWGRRINTICQKFKLLGMFNNFWICQAVLLTGFNCIHLQPKMIFLTWVTKLYIVGDWWIELSLHLWTQVI